MKQTTLVLLYKPDEKQLLLAMKKRGFGQGRWNGVGGKLQDGESIQEAAVREAHEEISVTIAKEDLVQVAIIDFEFEHTPDWNQQVHIFLVTKWKGEAIESEEMKPEWFAVQDIPFSDMWPADKLWLPMVLNGEHVKGKVVFGQDQVVTDYDLRSGVA